MNKLEKEEFRKQLAHDILMATIPETIKMLVTTPDCEGRLSKARISAKISVHLADALIAELEGSSHA